MKNHLLTPSSTSFSCFWELPHHHHPAIVWLNFPWMLYGICQLTLSIYWAQLLIWNITWQTATICLAPRDWQSKFFQVVKTDIKNYRLPLFVREFHLKGKTQTTNFQCPVQFLLCIYINSTKWLAVLKKHLLGGEDGGEFGGRSREKIQGWWWIDRLSLGANSYICAWFVRDLH